MPRRKSYQSTCPCGQMDSESPSDQFESLFEKIKELGALVERLVGERNSIHASRIIHEDRCPICGSTQSTESSPLSSKGD